MYEGIKKLAHKCFGLSEIVSKVGSQAYEPSSMKVHDIYHVPFLELYKHQDIAIPPALLPSGVWCLE